MLCNVGRGAKLYWECRVWHGGAEFESWRYISARRHRNSSRGHCYATRRICNSAGNDCNSTSRHNNPWRHYAGHRDSPERNRNSTPRHGYATGGKHNPGIHEPAESEHTIAEWDARHNNARFDEPWHEQPRRQYLIKPE